MGTFNVDRGTHALKFEIFWLNNTPLFDFCTIWRIRSRKVLSASAFGLHDTLPALPNFWYETQHHPIIGHLHDDIILLLRPESFRVLLSCANLNLTGITKFKYERKNEQDSGRSSKMTPSCRPIAKYFIPFRLLVSFIFTFTRVRQRAYHFVFLLMLADQ